MKTNIYVKYAHNFAIIASLLLTGQHLLLESKLVDLPVYTVNVGSLRGRLGETEQMLGSSSVDICCVRETRFRV